MSRENGDFKKEEDREVLESDLTVAAIFALSDPIRPEIPYSVKTCNEAGINIRMVTGDNINTAKAIAIEAGIVTKEEAEQEFTCMEGKDFREEVGGLKRLEDPSDRNLVKEEIGNKSQFRAIMKRLKVLARSTPEDKYMLVTGLKENDCVVAVTGDGTNDAPALKKADVGFAMGLTGTQVAQEASDIILLDDNFRSIVTAVKWGRNIYTNVRKFLQFQLTVNVVAMFIVFLGGTALGHAPLTAVQMLWVNLIMDTFAALALATEPPGDFLLKQRPYARNERIVTAIMWRNILGQALFQITILIVFLFSGIKIFGITHYGDQICEVGPNINMPQYAETMEVFYLRVYDPVTKSFGELTTNPTCMNVHYTMIFHSFVFMQVFNEINARKLGAKEFNVFAGFFNNWLFQTVIVITIIVQCALVQYGGIYIRAAPLSWDLHLICIGVGFCSLFMGVLIKLLPASWFTKFQVNEEIMTDDEAKHALTAKFKKSFRESRSLSKRKIQEEQATHGH